MTSNDVNIQRSSPNNQTRGVQTLLGDPKKAIFKLATPMIIAMLVQTLYNLVDALWVSGLGPDALAAVGFVFPFFFIILSVSTGIGVGAGSAISRRLGASDKEGADSVAVNSIVLMVVLSILFTIPLFLLSEPLFTSIGSGDTFDMAVVYGRILFAGTMIVFFTNFATSILRAEGDAKRSMYAVVLGAGLNVVLDPIFIYVLGFGVAGAAWATIISLAVTNVFLLNWLFLKKNTYVSFRFRGFRFNGRVLKEIFKVGIPASFQQLSMSLTMIILNLIIFSVASTDGVAVYQTGWRLVTIAILPLIGIATAVVSVTGAAFGAKDYRKLQTSHTYAIKMGLVIEIVVAITTFLLAPAIALVFSTGEGGERIIAPLTLFLQIVCLFYPGAALGILSSATFQGVGKGLNSLLVTVLRTVILATTFAWVSTSVLNLGLPGVWWSLVIANTTGSLITYLWVKYYIKKLFSAPQIV